jgi:hypothetical protein
MTYTIAFTPEMLIAIVPDGEDIEAAVAAYGRDAGETFHDYDIETGLCLTDDPEDRSSIVFTSIHGSCGFLTASDGATYDYAVRCSR